MVALSCAAAPAHAFEPQVTALGPVAPASPGPAGADGTPAVTWTGETFLFAWSHDGLPGDDALARVARVSADGGLLDRPARPLVPASGPVACTPAGCLMLARDPFQAQPLDRQGAPRGSAVTIRLGSGVSINSPALGTDGQGYLVFGCDWALRLSSEGVPLDREPIKTGLTAAEDGAPALAFDGGGYFGVCGRRGVRLGRDGAVVSAPVPLPSAGDTRVAWNGTHHLLVWWTPASGPLSAQRVAIDGTPIDPEPRLAISAPQRVSMEVASDGAGWLIAWRATDDRRTQAIRFGADGAALDPRPITVAESASASRFPGRPTLAHGGGTWMIGTTVQTAPDQPWRAHFVRLSGSQVAAPGPVLLNAEAPQRSWPRLAAGDGRFLVGWNDHSDRRGARIRPLDGGGSPTGAVVELVDGSLEVLAARDRGWSGLVRMENDTWLHRLTPDGQSESALKVSPGDGLAAPNALAGSGTAELALFHVYPPASRDDEADVRGVLLSNGEAVWTRTLFPTASYRAAAVWDGMAFRVTALRATEPPAVATLAIDPQGSSPPQSAWSREERFLNNFVRRDAPAVAAGVAMTLMLWHDGAGRVMGLRLAPGGPPLDATPFEVARGLARIDTVRVGWDGSRWLTIWRESPDAPTVDPFSDLRGRYLDRGGAPLGEVFTIARQVVEDDAPALACLPAGTCLVAHASQDRTSATPRDIHLVRLSALPSPATDAGGVDQLASGAGCHCHASGPPSASGALLVVVALVGAQRRRRRRS